MKMNKVVFIETEITDTTQLVPGKFYKATAEGYEGVIYFCSQTALTKTDKQVANLLTGEMFNPCQLHFADLVEIREPFTIYPQCTH